MAAACHTPPVPSPDLGPGPDPDVPNAVDTGDAAPDGVGDTGGDALPEDTGPDEVLILGINETGYNHPGSFSDLPEDSELHIELGSQGLWMVVLAFKTRGIFHGKVVVSGEVKVDGENEGALILAKQKLSPGGDGFHYYYNFFLVILDPSVGGKEALVTLKVMDDQNHDHMVEILRHVTLTGGQQG